MKRIITVQDISCLGKCSLTVALPVISACGVECCVIPTAVLSTHTAVDGFTFRDLTDEITPVTQHWKKKGFEFDGIYTGYLGSDRQIELVKKLFSDFGEKAIKIVDPAMADNGRLYSGFDNTFPDKMAKLCKVADIILPNLTEACLMLHREYIPSGYSREYIKDILKDLTGMGAEIAVITGISFEKGKTGPVCYNSKTGEYREYFTDRADESFHGTGDIFASVFTGAVTRGVSVYGAMKTAADFTYGAIRATLENENHNDYGVDFEAVLRNLPAMLDNVLSASEKENNNE